MKKYDTSHWQNVDKLEGLLFFSHLVDEMLFDYTLDSYKPSALNSRLLCIECIECIEEIRSGYISPKNIQSVVEELKWSLSKDIAAKDIFGAKFEQYINRLNPSEIKLNELENIVKLIYNSFQSRKYLNAVIKCLTNLIIEGKQKQKIRSLTAVFITELINYGYNQNYIYYQNSKFFFSKTSVLKIDTSDIIKDFFELFNFENKEFTVIFKGGVIFNSFKGTLNEFNIVVTKNYNCFSKLPEDLAFKDSLMSEETFIICTKIEALDHHSARESIGNLLDQVCGIFNFFHHDNKPQILDKTIVSRTDDNYVIVIEKPIKAMLKNRFDVNWSIAAKSVENTLKNINLTKESTFRFARSIDLHSAALTASATENKLLDLWAALETLLPKNDESKKDRIVQITESLLPFLQLNYTHKLLNDLHNDLILWNQPKTEEILAKLSLPSNFTILEKMGALVSLNETKSVRGEFYIALDEFPLLKNRLYTLHESFKSTEDIVKTLKGHETKLAWHIRRIYRTRGEIIHSGKYPSYTPTLIENLHSYIDLLLNKIIELSCSKKANSIEQVVLEIDIALQFQSDLLKKHARKELTVANFREALLGERS